MSLTLGFELGLGFVLGLGYIVVVVSVRVGVGLVFV